MSQVQISAGLVKELRDLTGAGMMDAKRALEETGGDVEAAQRLLREQGMAAAGKKAGRETTEGEVLATVSGNVGAIVAIGCETEPVSKNEEFLRFAEAVLEAVEADGAGRSGGAGGAAARARGPAQGKHRDPRRDANGGRRRRAARGVRPSAGEQDRRPRPGAREGPAVARRVAMHISFAAPRFLERGRRAGGGARLRARDLRAAARRPGQAGGGPRKIVEGRLRKEFLPAIALSEQAWIHDPSLTSAKALEEAGLEVLEFVRYALAE